MFKLEFFSGLGGYDDNPAHGYDGSMSVERFDASELPAHAVAMDCICGPIAVVVTSPGGNRRIYISERFSL